MSVFLFLMSVVAFSCATTKIFSGFTKVEVTENDQ
jgi:hypothetical protein